MNTQQWEIIKIVLTFIFTVVFVKVWDFLTGKKQQSLNAAKTFQEGENLRIEVKTNIDKLVEDKTKTLNSQIITLQDTIVQISTKYTNDLNNYLKRMADLEKKFDTQVERNIDIEKKFDDQIDRNKEMETQLQEEIRVRQDCVTTLKKLQMRVYELEKVTSTETTSNNPSNPDNVNSSGLLKNN